MSECAHKINLLKHSFVPSEKDSLTLSFIMLTVQCSGIRKIVAEWYGHGNHEFIG